ncbi:hypothetical protein [Desulfolithobacter dissulfuricans]|nr:hypothetical protein [Desulfolithobacter dissulfuricans]
MEQPHDLAILFSGGKDSLALYALAMQGSHPEIPDRRPSTCCT